MDLHFRKVQLQPFIKVFIKKKCLEINVHRSVWKRNEKPERDLKLLYIENINTRFLS